MRRIGKTPALTGELRDIDDNELIPAAGVRRILGISDTTFYNYISNGFLDAMKIGGRWKVPGRELKRFMYQGTKGEANLGE